MVDTIFDGKTERMTVTFLLPNGKPVDTFATLEDAAVGLQNLISQEEYDAATAEDDKPREYS